jgi:ATP-dependent DNA ligase
MWRSAFHNSDAPLSGLFMEQFGVPNFLYAQHVDRDGKLLFEEACSRNLEGVVAKRRMGPYAKDGWLKI